MKKLIHLAVISALSLPMATLAADEKKTTKPGSQQATQPAERTGTEARPLVHAAPAIRGSKLIGMNVKNKSGQNLGEIQDLVIDMNNNRVHYAVVDAQNKMFAYPMHVFRTDAGNNDLLLNVSEERLEKAPGMEKERWGKRGDAIDSEYRRDVETYWEKDRTERDPTAEGKTVKVEPRANMRLARGSKLIGKNIENRQGKDIGEIKDLIIDVSSGQVHFAVVEIDDKMFKKDTLHPVALSAFSFRDDRDKLVLNVEKDQLKAARSLTKDQIDTKLDDKNFLQETSRYASGIAPRDAEPGAAGRTGTPSGNDKRMENKGEPQPKKSTSDKAY
jgi:sporulation protein YlmC with PRC-barrel domain